MKLLSLSLGRFALQWAVFGLFAAITVIIVSIVYATASWGSLPTVSSGSGLTATAWNDLVTHVNQSVKQTSQVITVSGASVGIGTPTPIYLLDVNGNANISGTLDIGWEKISSVITYPTRGGTATCSAGKTVLSGWCITPDYSSVGWLGTSAPNGNNGWYCMYPAYPSSFTVYAICARAVPH